MGQIADIWRQYRRNKKAVFGIVAVAVLVLIAVFGPLLMTYDYAEHQVCPRFSTPIIGHPLGCDGFGRDILSRTVTGSRISLSVAAVVALLSVTIGSALGAVSGYVHGWLDTAIMGTTDVLFSIPSVLLALMVAAIIGPGLNTVVLALSVVYVPQFIRLMRGTVWSVSEMQFVEAAVCIGASRSRIVVRHILPSCMAPLLVQTTLVMSYVILDEAALSFLGLGTMPPMPSWGLMLREGVQYLFRAPHLALIPGAAISVVVLTFNLWGDGMRDVLDPFMRGRQ